MMIIISAQCQMYLPDAYPPSPLIINDSTPQGPLALKAKLVKK
jgi:hypothetical protein